jgi:hypothetical protein
MFAIDWSPHWTWFHYFVPSLWGNGPEAAVQTVVYSLAAVLLIPPVRRWAARHVENLKDHITGETKALHQKLDHHEELMHHIIKHHPDIPPFTSDTIVKKNPPMKKVGRDAHGRFTK